MHYQIILADEAPGRENHLDQLRVDGNQKVSHWAMTSSLVPCDLTLRPRKDHHTIKCLLQALQTLKEFRER
jgi:transposase-like protein